VLAGLRLIRATGKPVTVITVVHRGNVERVLDLSVRLAAAGMADQHHLCAPSYAGEARAHYANLRLGREDYLRLQDRIDAAHHTLAGQGLFVTFNSFWPATGRRSKRAISSPGRKHLTGNVTAQPQSTSRCVASSRLPTVVPPS
jgi:hypothetical protein